MVFGQWSVGLQVIRLTVLFLFFQIKLVLEVVDTELVPQYTDNCLMLLAEEWLSADICWFFV